MRFKVKNSVFKESASPVFDVALKGGYKEFVGLNKIYLDVDKDNISMKSYNGKISISCKLNNLNIDELNYNYEEEGQAVICARHLFDALSSFPDNEVLIFDLKESNTAKELYIKSKLDEEQYQTVLCFEDDIPFPDKATAFKKKIEMCKDVFVNAASKISFAYGYEQEKERFLHWILRVDAKKSKLRFMSGTNALFAIYDLEGDNAFIGSSPEQFNILFLNEHMSNVFNALSQSHSDHLKIEEADPNSNYQIRISSGIFEMILTGMNRDIEWVDEEKMLNYQCSFKAVTPIQDWSYATKGLLATHTKEMKKEKRLHKSEFELDCQDNVLKIKASDTLKSFRKVPILDSVHPDGRINCKSSTYTDFVAPLPTCWEKDGNLQIEFDGDSGRKPIFVYYNAADKVQEGGSLARTNSSTGLKEKFIVIFVQIV